MKSTTTHRLHIIKPTNIPYWAQNSFGEGESARSHNMIHLRWVCVVNDTKFHHPFPRTGWKIWPSTRFDLTHCNPVGPFKFPLDRRCSEIINPDQLIESGSL